MQGLLQQTDTVLTVVEIGSVGKRLGVYWHGARTSQCAIAALHHILLLILENVCIGLLISLIKEKIKDSAHKRSDLPKSHSCCLCADCMCAGYHDSGMRERMADYTLLNAMLMGLFCLQQYMFYKPSLQRLGTQICTWVPGTLQHLFYAV